MTSFTVYGIKTPVIAPNVDFPAIIIDSLHNQQLEVIDGDILVVSSKVTAIANGEMIDLNSIHPSPRALDLAKRARLDPKFVQVVLDDSDKVFGWAASCLMTIKDNILIANAGIDRSNAIKSNYVIPWPRNPKKEAEKFRSYFKEKLGVNIGVIMADSATRPMRRGATGVAIAVAGLPEVISDIGKVDLYGRVMEVKTRAIADNIVTSAELVIGETIEQTPVSLIRGLPYVGLPADMSAVIPQDQCIFMRNFQITEY